MNSDLVFKEETFAIIGACMRVHPELGNGFLEPVYQEGCEYEFEDSGIAFQSQVPVPLFYKGRRMKQVYIPDFVFVSFGKIILEIKAVKAIADDHRAQLLNYLSATRFPLGLPVNFGSYGKLEWERFANTRDAGTEHSW
ncbi:MAG: GxxExxY protein [Opitutales bacterium]